MMKKKNFKRKREKGKRKNLIMVIKKWSKK